MQILLETKSNLQWFFVGSEFHSQILVFEKMLMTLLCDNLNHTVSGMKGQNAAGNMSKS